MWSHSNHPRRPRTTSIGEITLHTEALKDAIELRHHCRAEHVRSVPVRENFGEKGAWEGVVEVFELVGHPEAQCCYGWFAVVHGCRQCITALHVPPVTSPHAAVRSKFHEATAEAKKASIRNSPAG